MSLLDYIKGHRQGKEANRLERESLEDAFLHEAIEGYDAVPGNHAEIISNLEKRIRHSPKRRKHNIGLILSIAASIFIFISIGSYFFQKQEIAIPEIAIKKKTLNNTSTPIAKITSKPDTVSIVNKRNLAIDKLSKNKLRIKRMNFIRGKIVSASGDILAGAIIKVKGKNIETIANIYGEFEIAISNKDSVRLIVSYLGMEDEEILLNPHEKEISIAMQDNPMHLDELVVQGYGSVSKRDLVSAVSSVSTSSIKNILPYSFKKHKFKKYFKKNAKKSVCGEEKAIVQVEFVINNNGRPSDINVLDATCEEAKNEVIRILQKSPRWSYKPGKKVTMKVEW